MAEKSSPIPPGLSTEEVIDFVEAGESLSSISTRLGVSRRSLCRWMRAEGAWQAYLDARQDAAEAYDEMALQVLRDAGDTKEEIARAREMASHYRWRAKSLNQQTYGDRQSIEVKTDISQMTDEQVYARAAALEAKRAAGSGI